MIESKAVKMWDREFGHVMTGLLNIQVTAAYVAMLPGKLPPVVMITLQRSACGSASHPAADLPL